MVRIPFGGFLVAFAVFIALALVLVLHGVLNADEGFYLAASHLVSEGYRPYRDFGYTQGPLFPYANLIWLEVFGHTLAGQRLAGLAWTLVTVALGAWWLKRKISWGASWFFVLMLVGAPVWLAFAVKGKTYAFAGLAVLVAVLAMFSVRPSWARWMVFITAAACGTGARLPVAGFFLPAFLGMLFLTPGWAARLGWSLTMASAACAVLVMGGAGDWARFVFWTTGFHRESSFYIPMWTHFADCFRFAPVIWAFAVLTALSLRERFAGRGHLAGASDDGSRHFAFREDNRKPLVIVLVSLAVAFVANLSASTTYAEYIFPFIPALAFTSAPIASALFERSAPFLRILIIMAVIFAGWNYPPELSPNVLLHAGQAEAFLRKSVPAGSVIAGSMPEIGVAAGGRIPLTMAMGKFGITEDFDAGTARDRRMVTPVTLQEILTNPDTKAFVGSPSYNWNFFWSLPSYRVLSPAARQEMYTTLRANYRLEFMNDEYVIYLRRPETIR